MIELNLSHIRMINYKINFDDYLFNSIACNFHYSNNVQMISHLFIILKSYENNKI